MSDGEHIAIALIFATFCSLCVYAYFRLRKEPFPKPDWDAIREERKRMIPDRWPAEPSIADCLQPEQSLEEKRHRQAVEYRLYEQLKQLEMDTENLQAHIVDVEDMLNSCR
jgi:cell division protein FtsN